MSNTLKRSLTETKDCFGRIVKLGDTVAYPFIRHNGAGIKIHKGRVVRITRHSVVVRPEQEYLDAYTWSYRQQEYIRWDGKGRTFDRKEGYPSMWQGTRRFAPHKIILFESKDNA